MINHNLKKMASICFIVAAFAIGASAQISIKDLKLGVKKPEPTKPASPNGNKTPPNVGGTAGNKGTGATREEVQSFQRDMRPYFKGMGMIRNMAKTANTDHPVGCSTAANTRKAMDDGAAFYEIVKQKYPNIENPTWANDGTGDSDVGDLRRYAENRVEHAKGCINATFAVVLRDHVKEVEQATASLKSGKSEGFVFGREFDDPAAHHARLSEKYKEIYAVVGMTMADDSVFAPYDAALKDLVDEARNHVAEWTFPAPYHNAMIEAKARGFFAKWEPRGTIVKMGVKYSDWKVDSVNGSIPKGRANGGYIMFRRPGAQPCLVVSFSYEQDYMGGGKYNEMAITSGMGNGLRLQNCK